MTKIERTRDGGTVRRDATARVATDSGRCGFPAWVGLCLAVSLTSGCNGTDGSSPQPVEPSAALTSTEDCTGVASLHCDTRPIQDLAQGCEQLRSCLGEVITTDRPLSPAISCDPPQLPIKPGPLEVAVLAVDADFEGVPSHAAYLLIRGEGGWCPGHELLEPSWSHGGYCDSEFEFHWATPREGDSSPRLDVRSDSVCHMPLDQEELEAGESDIASQSCVISAFEVENGMLLARAREAFAQPCVELSQEETDVLR